jgi:predicted O-methyltransferase YrrM
LLLAPVVAASIVASISAAEETATPSLDLAQAHATETHEKVKPDIFYLPTPQRLVDVMLLMAEVKKDDLLYDLGSGDGRLVITAAQAYGARGIGIEIDPALLAIARRNAARAKVEDKVEFRQQDLFQSDFKDASVITLYLLDELNRRLRPQIFAQVRPGTRIVSHAFHMGDWQPDAEKTLTIEGKKYDAYFWVVPANMSGRWKVTGGSKPKGMPETIVIEQAFQEITVHAAESDEVLATGKLAGSEFYLTMGETAAAKAASFSGTIEGNSIKATGSGRAATWHAEREAGTEKPLEPAT